ncbi:MAG: ribonuclease HII [Synergistaceae bacterium]|nr:ribonuclease HII [Synergistaceae bacterium]
MFCDFADNIVAGTDEAGRGPLAGPVVAAAAILTSEQQAVLLECGLKDSKKLSHTARERIFEKICVLGIEWSAQAASPARIDRVNILQASLWCMKRSVEKLRVRPDIVLIDGNCLIPNLKLPQESVIKGDDKIPAIAAASVVAKVLRDRVMTVLDKIYPDYDFVGHKGYPSAKHREILKMLGPSPIHRLSFRGVVIEQDNDA